MGIFSNTMTAEWCTEELEQAIEVPDKPEMFNTDQGRLFTIEVFTGCLKKHEVLISMDGKGWAIDNIFIERLWRSVKYEQLYLYTPANGISSNFEELHVQSLFQISIILKNMNE